MKLLFTFLLAMLSCQFGYSGEIISIEEDEKIDIEDQPQKKPNKDRSIANIECYLSRTENTIRVEYSGIGIPVVYILDVNGNILSYNLTNGISGNIIINLPQAQGIYTVLIQSQVYCGEGIFYIY